MLKINFSAILVFLSITSAFAEPYIPARDDVVLATLSSSSSKFDARLKKLADTLKKDTQNTDLAIELSKGYLQASRVTGDPRYASYAETAIKPFLQVKSPLEEVLIIKATLQQFRHDFKGALSNLNKVLVKKPGNIQARITRSNINRVQGNFKAAIRDCRALVLQTDPLVVAICQSNITSVTGKAQWSYDNLAKLLAKRGEGVPGNVKNWAQATLAELAEIAGDSKKAEQHFLDADADNTTASIYLRSAYIDLLIDQNRFQDAYNQISENNLSDPMMLRKAIAAKKAGNQEYAKLSRIIRSRFMDSSVRGDTGHLREESRFELYVEDNPERALELARKNWKTQREIWDTRLVLEAAIASEKYNEALEVISWIKKSGLEDKRVLKLVSKIKEARG